MNPSLLEPGIFLNPRPKKNLLSSLPNKRRKTEHKIEEINFDDNARADYLTGFHKRKVQRAKRAQEEAMKKGREERVEMRKQLREERKVELTEHVSAINAALRAVGDPDVLDSSSDSEAWSGISDDESKSTSKSKQKSKSSSGAKSTLAGGGKLIDHEEMYASEDEDKYTTVTVEAVDITKEGLSRVADDGDDDEEAEAKKKKWEEKKEEDGKKKVWPKKPRKEKFRYESKLERKAGRMKQKNKNKASADARKGGG